MALQARGYLKCYQYIMFVEVIITKFLQNISIVSQLQQCASILAQASHFSARALHTRYFYARKSILCRIYTEYIHHLLSVLQILKVHCRNIARKLHDIFFCIRQWEKRKALPCISCIQTKRAFEKNKCSESSMRSTSICSSGACVKIGQFT